MSHMTLVFDTLQYAKKLREAGVSEQQAEVQAEALAEIIEDNVASKIDLKELAMQLNLRMAELKHDLIKWVCGLTVAQAAIIISCIKFIH